MTEMTEMNSSCTNEFVQKETVLENYFDYFKENPTKLDKGRVENLINENHKLKMQNENQQRTIEELLNNNNYLTKESKMQIYTIKCLVDDKNQLNNQLVNMSFENLSLFDCDTDEKLNTLIDLDTEIVFELTNVIDKQYEMVINNTRDLLIELELAYDNLLSLQSKVDLGVAGTNTINEMKRKIDRYGTYLGNK